MIVPMNLIGFFQTPDDYNIHWLVASFFAYYDLQDLL